MLKVKISDKMMFDLLIRADKTEHTDNSIVLGSGSDRTAIIYNDYLIAKVPHWFHIKDKKIPDWIKNRKKYCSKSGILTSKDIMLYIYAENQSAIELEIAKIIPVDIIKQYAAEIVMWGEWHNHIITFCERLNPIDEYDCDSQTILDDAKDLLYDMERTMRNYPIKVSDLHIENFAYTNDGKIKFCDLGYWNKSNCGFYINWENIESWENEQNYSDYSNYEDYSL